MLRLWTNVHGVSVCVCAHASVMLNSYSLRADEQKISIPSVCVCECVCLCDISIPSVSVFGSPAGLQTVLFATLSSLLLSVCVNLCVHEQVCVHPTTFYSWHVTKLPFRPLWREHAHRHTPPLGNVSCKVCCNDTAWALKLCL